jgi:hypothetical protein
LPAAAESDGLDDMKGGVISQADNIIPFPPGRSTFVPLSAKVNVGKDNWAACFPHVYLAFGVCKLTRPEVAELSSESFYSQMVESFEETADYLEAVAEILRAAAARMQFTKDGC